MDLTLPGKAFLGKLQSVTKALPGRSIKHHGDVELHAYGSGLTILSREADTWACRALSAAVASTGSVSFSGRAVVSLLEGMDSGSLRIAEVDELDHVVRFESSTGRTVEIPTGPAPERRDPPMLRDTHLTVPLLDFARGLQQVVHAQGRRVESLPWSRGVHFLDTPEGLRLTACDGFRMASVVVPRVGASAFESELLHPGVIVTSHGPAVILDLLDGLQAEGETLVDIEELHGASLLFKGRNNDRDRAGVGLLMVAWPRPAEPGSFPKGPAARCDAQKLRQEINYVLGSRASERSDPTIELQYTPSPEGSGSLRIARKEDSTGVKTEARLVAEGAGEPFRCFGNGVLVVSAVRGFRFGSGQVSVTLEADSRSPSPKRKILKLYCEKSRHLCEIGVFSA